MIQPPGFIDKDRLDHLCLLLKAIYGLKQAPRAWYNELHNFFLSIGFKNSYADASLFVLNTGTTLVYILVYVDDIIITGSCPAMVSSIIENLSDRFSLKDLGELSYFLGIEVFQSPYVLCLSQQKYTTDLLSRTNMTNAKHVAMPFCSTQSLVLACTKFDDPTEYRTVVSSL